MPMPQMPNIPGAGVMTDTLDFVKNLWGSMGVVPGIAAPTLSVDELDKKINDLRAVEAWLNLNSSMVRGSIQALEVQRNTIATLKSMGKTLADAVQQQQPAPGKEKSLFESIPYASAFFQHAADALAPGAPGPAPSAAPAAAAQAPATEAPTQAPAAKAEPAAAPPVSDAEAAAAAAAPMVNAAAWWNLLQDQFKQAVTTAMTTDVVSGAAARATEAASKFAAAAGKPPVKADKGNLPEEQDKPAAKKNGGKNGGAPAPARKAPAKRAGVKNVKE